MEIKKISDQNFQRFVEKSTYTSAFQQIEWIRVLRKVFDIGFQGYILRCANTDFILPTFTKEGEISVGYIGYGGPTPLGDEPITKELLLELIREIRIYFGENFKRITSCPLEKLEGLDSISYTRILDLSSHDMDFIQGSLFTSNIRSCLVKARRSKIEIENIGETNIKQAYDILASTQSRVGSDYVTSFDFFKEVVESSMAYSTVSKISGKIVATSAFILCKNEMFHLFNGSDPEYKNLCPNHLLLEGAIEFAVHKKIPIFNFGSSHAESLDRFKARWGAKKVPFYRSEFLDLI